MIKVGQIYKSNFTFAIRVITFIDDSEVSLIHPDGYVDRWSFDDIANTNWELIAEYPTWQEAVNSKEFKGE
jgi:hypothetical protein